jgi:ATP-binding cassette subfamily B (MDR/TAP) protein 1
MFYVGAVLIVDGRYTFAKMTEVFTLIIFSITFSAQIMTYRTSPASLSLILADSIPLSTRDGEGDPRKYRLPSPTGAQRRYTRVGGSNDFPHRR